MLSIIRKKIESLHQSIHELIHILGVPNEKLTVGKDANGPIGKAFSDMITTFISQARANGNFPATP